jgi:WD40 repeat protein
MKVNLGSTPLYSVAVSPDGQMVAAGNDNGEIQLWSIRDERLLSSSFSAGPTTVYVLAFDPEGTTLVAGTREGTLVLWDITRKVVIGTLRRHAGRVLALAFNRAGTLLASGGNDNKIIVWDWRERQPMGKPLDAGKGTVYSLAFAGEDLLAGYASGTVLAWRVDLPDWERNACRAAGRDLTPAERTQFLASLAPDLSVCEPHSQKSRRFALDTLHDLFRFH